MSSNRSCVVVAVALVCVLISGHRKGYPCRSHRHTREDCPDWHYCNWSNDMCFPCTICRPGMSRPKANDNNCKPPVACVYGNENMVCPSLYPRYPNNTRFEYGHSVAYLGVHETVTCTVNGSELTDVLGCNMSQRIPTWVGSFSCVTLEKPVITVSSTPLTGTTHGGVISSGTPRKMLHIVIISVVLFVVLVCSVIVSVSIKRKGCVVRKENVKSEIVAENITPARSASELEPHTPYPIQVSSSHASGLDDPSLNVDIINAPSSPRDLHIKLRDSKLSLFEHDQEESHQTNVKLRDNDMGDVRSSATTLLFESPKEDSPLIHGVQHGCLSDSNTTLTRDPMSSRTCQKLPLLAHSPVATMNECGSNLTSFNKEDDESIPHVIQPLNNFETTCRSEDSSDLLNNDVTFTALDIQVGPTTRRAPTENSDIEPYLSSVRWQKELPSLSSGCEGSCSSDELSNVSTDLSTSTDSGISQARYVHEII